MHKSPFKKVLAGKAMALKIARSLGPCVCLCVSGGRRRTSQTDEQAKLAGGKKKTGGRRRRKIRQRRRRDQKKATNSIELGPYYLCTLHVCAERCCCRPPARNPRPGSRNGLRRTRRRSSSSSLGKIEKREKKRSKLENNKKKNKNKIHFISYISVQCRVGVIWDENVTVAGKEKPRLNSVRVLQFLSSSTLLLLSLFDHP